MGEAEGLGYEVGLLFWWRWWLLAWWSLWADFVFSWSSSNTLTISSMSGLNLESIDRHWSESIAAFCAWGSEYWPSSRGSITRNILLLLVRYGFAHSTRLCSPDGRFLSIARRPDNISRRTTPKLYMSLFVVKWPSQQPATKMIRTLVLHFFSLYSIT